MQNQNPTNTPIVWHPTDADAQQLSPTQQEQTYIHSFSNLDWDTDTEPMPSTPHQLYHLLTLTGLMLIAPYPSTHTLGEHYIAWAPLTSEPTLTIH